MINVRGQEGHAAGDFVRIINKEYNDLNPKEFAPDSHSSQTAFDIAA